MVRVRVGTSGAMETQDGRYPIQYEIVPRLITNQVGLQRIEVGKAHNHHLKKYGSEIGVELVVERTALLRG